MKLGNLCAYSVKTLVHGDVEHGVIRISSNAVRDMGVQSSHSHLSSLIAIRHSLLAFDAGLSQRDLSSFSAGRSGVVVKCWEAYVGANWVIGVMA